MRKLVAIFAAAAMLAMPISAVAGLSGDTGSSAGTVNTTTHTATHSSTSYVSMAGVTQGSGAAVSSSPAAEIFAKLPEKAKATSVRINAGNVLYQAVGGDSAYLIPKKALTFVTVTTAPVNAIAVPNLTAGLKVQILYFDLKSNKWVTMDPISVDYATQTIMTNLPAGTPYTIIY